MYEIWLILNTFYELTLANLGLVVALLVIWLAVMVAAGAKKRIPWSRGLKPAVVAAVVAWVMAFVLVPSATRSAFANVTYFWDYLVLAGVALACAGLVAAFVWPVSLLLRRA